MDCSMPGFTVHHQLLELAQTDVHQVGDAIQPSHPLSSPSPAFNLSQHQGLFQGVSYSHQVAKVLELQHQSLNIQGWFPLGLTGHLCMKCSLGISNFLEDISTLSHSIVFLLFLCIVHLRRLSYLSLLFSGTLHSVESIFSLDTLIKLSEPQFPKP